MAGMARDFTVGDTKTGKNGITQVGIGNTINFADPTQKQRHIQKWYAWWLFESQEPSVRSQPQVLKEKGTAAAGTGSWLTQNLLPEWLRSGEDALWIHGNVIFSFDAQYQDSPEFFCRTCLACLYALSPTPVRIETAYENYLNAMQISGIDDLVLNVLEDVATGIRAQEAKPLEIVIVIDAVDETKSSKQQAFLRYLNRLIGSNRQDRLVRFRSILFSRDSQIIRHFCGSGRGWRKEEIPPLALKEDILKAVSSRLADDYNFQNWKVDDRNDLAARIATRANGMFRLAALYVEHLIMIDRRKIPASQLKTILADLPGALYPFYDRIFWQIQTPNIRQHSFNSMRWICYSARPLTLRELAAACAISGLPDGYDCDNDLDAVDLVKYLSGLIHISPPLPGDGNNIRAEAHSITIAHFSVEEYLKAHVHANFGLDTKFYDRSAGNLLLAQACITYAAQEHFNESMYSQNDRAGSLRGYVINFWAHHLAAHVQSRAAEQTLHQRLSIVAFALRIKNACMYRDVELYEDAGGLQKEVEKLICSVIHQRHYLDLLQVLLSKPHPTENIPFGQLDSGQLRLLLLRPALAPEAPIQCELVVDWLENKPKYQFLSYLWGDASLRDSIILSDLKYTVTRSLYKALLGLRHKSTPGVLWVDQVCINQQDVYEKNHQVARLSSTAADASAVYCWFGNVEAEELARDRSEIFRDPLWTRAWVMQEMILARENSCIVKGQSLDWLDVVHMAKDWVHVFHGDDVRAEWVQKGEGARNMLLVQETRESRNGGRTKLKLEELVYRFRATKSQIALDKVFAFVGLASDDPSAEGLVDYTLDLFELYARFGQRSILGSQCLDILSINNNRIMYDAAGGVSWSPCWHEYIEEHPLAPGIFDPGQPQLFRASRELFITPSSFDPLTMKAILIDTVHAVDHITTFLQFKAWETRRSVWSSSIESEDLGLIVRTALEGRVIDQQLKTFRRIDESDIESAKDFAGKCRTWKALMFLPRTKVRRNRQFCRTERGLIANVPLMTMPGDIVVLFPNAKTPHILRPAPLPSIIQCPSGTLPVNCMFVGECYVDGYMNGEAEDECEAGKLFRY
ncbi:hypothetical protein G7Y89_g4280 [Cudoniella acicularis]|uniref:Heterokaryon incompatibility domain-containing protein n=1 Tax=Cudoniella acicularis TaxID=354080 RepID=A0A8H4RSS7_9HELO|nr:hypothetical protein G7Y89_g4280 [Cudoniella acicularis]